MEPLKINFWLVGELIGLLICFVSAVYSIGTGQMNTNTACIVGIGIAILASVESEQRNAD